jgi:HD-like signal output (HDOD) protein
MPTPASFTQLLPHCADPHKEELRARFILVLESRGEILPAANSPRGKLWRLVNTPDASAVDCAEVIELDSALAMRILAIANSGAYGGSSDSITDAVVRLGFKFIRQQVFTDVVFKQFSHWELPKEWDAFWLRNIFVARLCERIASAYTSTNGTEYLAGLLHDMGWLFIATYCPEEFTQVFTCGLPIYEAEATLLPFGHAQVSAAIAARALLPERAITAIAMHHFPVMGDSQKVGPLEENPYFLSIVLHLSDDIADACHMNMFGDGCETFETLTDSPPARWLNRFRGIPDLARVADEELTKSKRVFDAFFSNRQFR